MRIIILLLIINSYLQLHAMDQSNDPDSDQEDYLLNAMEQYHQILEQILEKKGNDPNLWLESCKLAGTLKTCVELGLVNDQHVENSIKHILQNHEETTQLFTQRMELIERIELANRPELTKEE
jgi:hypothetical protein